MKKIMFGMFTFALIFMACEKKEVKNPNEETKEGLKIEGKWQLKTADFLSENAHWDSTVEYNEGNYFGHAPSMFKLYLGFEFTDEKVSSGVGNKLNLYNTRINLNPGNEYWYWNYTNNKKGFEMTQINPYSPPYNFSILDIRNINVLDDENKVVFEGDVFSRVPGQSLTTTQLLPVEITMEKGTLTDTAATAEVFILGEIFQP